MRHVVMFSGGVGSWAAAKRVAERHSVDDMALLFTDTLIEGPDTYRFLIEAAKNVLGCRSPGRLVDALAVLREDLPRSGTDSARKDVLQWVRQEATERIPGFAWIADGRTIWEVFRDVSFLGNTRADPCSKILKRDLADAWLEEHYEPDEVTVYVGIDWSEEHRFTRLAERKRPWVYEAPLCNPPLLTKDDMHAWAESEGIEKQRLYKLGHSHSNCGGGCIKMGQGGFALLYRTDPCTYAEWEENEQKLRDQLGDVAILRDRRGGETTPLTLKALRERIEDDAGQVDMFDIGGCGCFVEGP